MPQRILTPAEMTKLASLSERFRPIAERIIDDANQLCAGHECQIQLVYGRRSHADQLAIWGKGRALKPGGNASKKLDWTVTGKVVTNAFPGESPHNVGEAIDLALISAGKWLGDKDPRWPLVIGAVAKKYGMVWGGNFKLRDYAHVEHPQWKEALSAA